MYNQNKVNSANVKEVRLSELDLPFKTTELSEYYKENIHIVGNELIVGYLSDDHHCETPFSEGSGLVYSAHRNSTTHEEMQDSLALNHEWLPDLSLIEGYEERLRSLWLQKAQNSLEFQIWAEQTPGARPTYSEAYYKRRAAKLWREDVCSIDDFDFTHEVKVELWSSLRSEGLIGDQCAVMLDCYEHGGQCWSISGAGIQDRWDTANGIGCWIPDEVAKEEIERRAACYSFGQIKDNGAWSKSGGRKLYYVEFDSDFATNENRKFNSWSDAFEWMMQVVNKHKPLRRKLSTEKRLLIGRRRAATELAECTLETYNQWLQGSVFGVVIATFNNVGTQDNPKWAFDDSEEVWGYIGGDNAMEEMTYLVKSKVENLAQKVA